MTSIRYQNRANKELRARAKSNNVYLWEIANKMNVSEPTITRWFRTEMDHQMANDVKKAIDDISRNKRAE